MTKTATKKFSIFLKTDGEHADMAHEFREARHEWEQCKEGLKLPAPPKQGFFARILNSFDDTFATGSVTVVTEEQRALAERLHDAEGRLISWSMDVDRLTQNTGTGDEVVLGAYYAYDKASDRVGAWDNWPKHPGTEMRRAKELVELARRAAHESTVPPWKRLYLVHPNGSWTHLDVVEMDNGVLIYVP